MKPGALRVIEMPRGHCAGGRRCWKCLKPIAPHQPYGATYAVGEGTRTRWHLDCTPELKPKPAPARLPRRW